MLYIIRFQHISGIVSHIQWLMATLRYRRVVLYIDNIHISQQK